MASKGIRGLYKRGRIWWMTYSVEKKHPDGAVFMDPIRESTGKTKQGDAERILDAVKQSIREGRFIPSEQRAPIVPHPWGVECDAYLADRERRGKRTDSYRKLADWR